jgi:hypothetical protein
MRKDATKEEEMNRWVQQVLVLIAVLTAVVPLGVSQDRLSIGTVAYNYVGRIYIDPVSGTGEVAGYFTSVAGIQNAFQGTPSEATAYFTYRSDPLSFTALPADVDTAITLLNAGKWHIYYNPNPAGNWNNPSSFSQGQLVADLNHNALQIVSAGPAHSAVFSGELIGSYDFLFGGKVLNLANSFPNGITNFSFATNTVAPGPAAYPVTFADAGWGVAKGHTPGK